MTETEIKIKLKISTEDWDEKQSKFLDFYAENGYILCREWVYSMQRMGITYLPNIFPSFTENT